MPDYEDKYLLISKSRKILTTIFERLKILMKEFLPTVVKLKNEKNTQL